MLHANAVPLPHSQQLPEPAIDPTQIDWEDFAKFKLGAVGSRAERASIQFTERWIGFFRAPGVELGAVFEADSAGSLAKIFAIQVEVQLVAGRQMPCSQSLTILFFHNDKARWMFFKPAEILSFLFAGHHYFGKGDHKSSGDDSGSGGYYPTVQSQSLSATRLPEPSIDPTSIDWEDFAQVENHWDHRCQKNWRKFLRACAVELLDRLPPEAVEWMAQADRCEASERYAGELVYLRERAWEFYRAQQPAANEAQLCALYVAMYRLLPLKEDWLQDDDQTCNFVECCLVAGMRNERLNRLLREHFPSAFERRPWWRFW